MALLFVKPTLLKIKTSPVIAESQSDWKNYFDRVVVINLKRRPDRLSKFYEEIKDKGYCFDEIEVFDAIDGNALPVPYGWEQGGGAWGCMQSHRQILERAMMDGINSILIFEDDIVLCNGFVNKLKVFLDGVDPEWDQLMLGGQHMKSPRLIKSGVVKCFDCQRTHAYAVRGRFMRELYATWCSPNSRVHCDWIMGPLQSYFKVYAPDPFLVGQSASRSDISGNVNPVKFWIPPSGKEHLILLKCPKDLLPALRKRGVHTGNRRNSEDIDIGVAEAFTQENPVHRLCKWVGDVMWEVKSDDKLLVAACWHEKATLPILKMCWAGPVHEISGDNVDGIINKIKSCLLKVSML